jgi:hypothetical protein
VVLYLACVSFFAPQREKTTHKELNIFGKRKPYVSSYLPGRVKKNHRYYIRSVTDWDAAKD